MTKSYLLNTADRTQITLSIDEACVNVDVEIDGGMQVDFALKKEELEEIMKTCRRLLDGDY
jgi:phosphotransacetylase